MSSINRDYLIFPLSCDPALEETEEREIYYKYLDSAFDDPRIHNIGIAGGFGVGKSSLLRSYEKRYLRMANLKQKPRVERLRQLGRIMTGRIYQYDENQMSLF